MKKIIIIFSVSTILLLLVTFIEGFYILKCRNTILQFSNEISNLHSMNGNLRSEIQKLENSTFDLENENNQMKNALGENHPINIKQQECMKKQNYTTAAMNSCTYLAIDDWYKEIDIDVLLLKKYMTKQQYNLLVDSQNKWNAYEKAERKLLVETIGTFVGTMYTTVLAGKQEALVETRAKNIHSLYEFMSDEDIMKN